MSKVKYPPAPPGYKYVFVAWIHCPHTGRKIWASERGRRAFRLTVPV